MTTHDISRYLFQPAKHYIGARWQQGRCLLDSDFNEDAQLDDEDQRRVLNDVIGPSGSPDQGFAVDLALGDEVLVRTVSLGTAPPADVLDLRLRPGSMYVGGLRFEHEPRVLPGEVTSGGGDPIVFQRDFLQLGPGDAPLAQPGSTHTILTVLHAWEQHVSAVEDEELRERALGGVDTSVRVRRMARVEARSVEADDCSTAWNQVREAIESDAGGTFDVRANELLSSARLRITFDDGAAEDPCAPCGPHDAGRYLGANNQAIRIMLVEPPSGGGTGRYVWAFDNASPLYRVQAEVDDSGPLVRMLTPPRDEARWPLAHTVIELLPWGALLDNGQKLSAPLGVFVRVTEGYDPDTRTFRTELPALDDVVWGWDLAHPDRGQLPNAADPVGQYFYMRVWHRLDPEDVDILLDAGPAPGNHHLLRRLGLRPQFTGTGKPGDFWVVTVRPNTPQQLVPWNLTQGGGVPPHGPRHFYAPLTLMTLRPPLPGENEGTEVVEALHDCRRRFRPLVEHAGCCTHTVGDGVASHGEYASIRAAIEALPAAGGRVCILPGRYAEELVVDRSDVIIEGCGAHTELETPAGSDPAQALIHVLAPRVTIRELVLQPRGQIGVLVGSPALDTEVLTEDVALERLEIAGQQRAGVGGQTRATIDVRNGRRVRVSHCELTMDGSLADDAAVFVRGEHIRVEHNRIETFPSGSSFGAWGGVQIGGGSQHVELRRNRIVGGIGHGITLGSLRWIPDDEGFDIGVFGAGAGLQDLQDPCAPKQASVQAIFVGTVRYEPRSAGDLDDIRIVDNHIEAMSGNGISVLTTLSLDEEGEEGPGRITVDRISIERNRIVGNVVQASGLLQASITAKSKQNGDDEDLFGQFGLSTIQPAGIALVDGAHVVIRDNEIRGNGTNDSRPICGISILFGDRIVIEGNRIIDNGRRDPGSIASSPATRAGIAVSLAGVAPNTSEPEPGDLTGSSLRVVGNIVEHPNGPALAARAAGPMMIEGNHLESLGNNASAQSVGRAHAVVLVDMGMPWEAVDLPTGAPSATSWEFPNRTPEYLQGTEPTGNPELGDPGEGLTVGGQGGRVLFNNNHVTLRWTQSTTAGGLVSGFSVGICAHDDVTMIGNQLALDVQGPGVKKKAPDALDQRPRMLAHAMIVGATANVAHNRISEGVNDALISLAVLGGLLVSSRHNITTHESFASTCNTFVADSADPLLVMPNERVDVGNLVWLRPYATASSDNLVSQTTVRRAANQLFATFCDTCLGLPVEERDFIGGLASIAVLLDEPPTGGTGGT
jgi:Family of unknown function (DUF6519)/Right handed beta helix region